MISLQIIPPELLDLILRDSPFAITLWQCGNKAFNQRLSAGVTELSLHHFPYKEFSIPKMVLELRNLKRLELYASGALLADAKAWIRVREELPRTLESLTIDSKDSHQIFLDFDSAKLVNGKYQPDRDHGYIYIESILPSLQNLALKYSARPVERSSEMGSRSRFPFTGHALRVSPVDRSFLSSLPPSLTCLSIDNGRFQLPFISLLPQNIQLLHVTARLSSPKDEDECIEQTLDDLAKLPLGVVLNRMEAQFSAEQLLSVATLDKSFPPGLLSLALGLPESCPPSLIAHLPRTLTRLEFVNSVDPSLFSNSEESDGENELLQHSWPPCLHSLLIKLKSFKRGTLAALPRQLKSLHLSIYSTGNIFHVEGAFPPSLTRMLCSNMFSMHLCAKITTLTELTILEPYFVFVPLTEYPRLSSPILTLELEGWHFERLGDLPRSVTDLTIRNLVMPKGPISNTPVLVELRDLPIGLLRLTIIAITKEWQVDQQNFLGSIPKGALPLLTHLQLPKHICLYPESLKHLPRSLKYLETSISWIGGKSKHLASLPPNLASTKLDDFAYHFEDLGDQWPPTAWRGLVSTPGAHHIPKLLERLRAATTAAPSKRSFSFFDFFKSK